MKRDEKDINNGNGWYYPRGMVCQSNVCTFRVQRQKREPQNFVTLSFSVSGWQDSNLRPSGPKPECWFRLLNNYF